MQRVTDYATLVSAIQELVNLDTGSSVDSFIQAAEADVGRQVDSVWQENTEVLAVPVEGLFFFDSKRAVLRISIDETPLEHLHIDTARETYRGWTPDKPRAYSVVGGSLASPATQHVEFWPPPPDSTTYQAELAFKLVIPELTGANTTNWLLNVAPDAYLYGSALHAVVFNGDDTSLGLYQAQYDRAVAGVIREVEQYHSLQRAVSMTGSGGYDRWLP